MSNALLALINQRKASVSRVKTLKPNAGRNRYRILPSWRVAANTPAGVVGEDLDGWLAQFYMDFGQHFIKDAAGQIQAVYVCTDKTFGRPCPICHELARAMAGDPDELTKKRLKDTQSSGRVLLNVLHLDGPTPDQVQILEVAPSVFNGAKGGVGGIISMFQDWPNLIDIEGGADVIIEKSGTGMDTRYGVSVVPSSVKLNKSVIVPKLHDLDKFVAQESAQGAQRALASVSAITGLLPAPSRPTLAQAAMQEFEDIPDSVTMTGRAQAAAPAAPVTTPPWQEATVFSAPAAAPAPAPAAGELDDLEALLKGL